MDGRWCGSRCRAAASRPEPRRRVGHWAPATPEQDALSQQSGPRALAMIGELASTQVSAARPRAVGRRLEASPALFLGGLFFLTISALAVARHQAFATGRHDLEIYSQVTWGLANGAPFSTTLLRSNTLHL